MRSEYSTEQPVRRAALPSDESVARFSDALLDTQRSAAYQHIVKDRGLAPKVLKQYKIGWDERSRAYTIPMRGPDRRLANVKWIQPPWAASDGKRHMWVCAGHPSLFLWPSYRLGRRTPTLVCEGEWDALTAATLGFEAVTSTGGSGKWDDDWNSRFRSLTVVIVRDMDGAGLSHARLVTDNLASVAKTVRVLRWSDVR